MAQEIGKRVTRVCAVTTCVWCIALLVCIGCHRVPEPAPFHRFVEDVVAGDRWHETKVRIGNETRNVLSAPYRSTPKEIEVAEDGTIVLGAVADVEKIRPDATGVTVRVQTLPLPDWWSGEEGSATSVYVPKASDRDVTALAETTVEVLPAGEAGRTVRASAREVLSLPLEQVTKTVAVPQSARLDFGIGIEGEPSATRPPPVQFSVEVLSDEERTTIFSETLKPKQELAEPRWVDASVDLSDLAGSNVRFVFRTESNHGAHVEASDTVVPLIDWSPVWSSPILYSTQPAREDTRPNVILISLDTLRADHLGCYGYHRNTSPNIDKFAEEAFLFENCIAPSSWTLPSHASVFTGLYPSVHGSVLFLWGPPIGEAEVTLTELAREDGYLTAAYTEGGFVRAGFGFAQGFEQYSDGEHRLPLGSAEQTFTKARAWLDKYDRLPFFIFVHTYQIHGPYRPPGRFASLFDTDYAGPVGKEVFGPRGNLFDRESPGPERSFSEADIVHLEALYDGEIAYTDEVLGNFLDELRRARLLENTVVIIFSDHGEEFREHGGLSHGRTLYDEMLRVPLIIRPAGNDPPAGRIARQVSLTDLYGTVVGLLGIDHKIPPDCISFASLMGTSKSRARYERNAVIGELYKGQKNSSSASGSWWNRCVRTNDEKYIVSEKEETEELYDLRNDPRERNDIAAQHQTRLERYRELLHLLLKAAAAGRMPSLARERQAVPPLTEEDRRQLEALGYM